MAVKVIKFRVRVGEDIHYPGAILSDFSEQDEEDLIREGICEKVPVIESKGSKQPDVIPKEPAQPSEEETPVAENETDSKIPDDTHVATETVQSVTEQTSASEEGPDTSMPTAATSVNNKGRRGK